ncbi:MAG: DoxX family protein [Gammaproteobacteria bacterium]|nr:DoxX family protein [Gammaproteobacteria bacterium]
MIPFIHKAQQLFDTTRAVDFLAPLCLRLYLAPIFWMAGTQKLGHFSSTVEWFGNADWGLGLPFPWLMAALATGTELVGAVCLIFGFATRWISFPLMMTMLVAIFSVHLENGWLAIAAGGGFFASERTAGGIERLNVIKDILKEHGNYEWLTENGSVVILNNGIEFATTYLFILLALFFIGGGRYLSIDYWVDRKFNPTVSKAND